MFCNNLYKSQHSLVFAIRKFASNGPFTVEEYE